MHVERFSGVPIPFVNAFLRGSYPFCESFFRNPHPFKAFLGVPIFCSNLFVRGSYPFFKAFFRGSYPFLKALCREDGEIYGFLSFLLSLFEGVPILFLMPF